MAFNQFLQAAIRQIARHGVLVNYITVTEGAYDVETGTTVNTESTVTFKAFPKRLKITQFNYPNLIGKQVIEFLVAGNSLTSLPKPQDKVLYLTDTYTVDSHIAYTALGDICLFKILCVKS